MFLINFLNKRQFGFNSKSSGRASDHALNVDHLLSQFVCLKNDVFTVPGEINDVPPFTCRFRRDSFSDLLAVAAEDGTVTLYDTRTSTSKNILTSFSAHRNAIWDICWLPDKCQLITGSGDLSACLWDMISLMRISEFIHHTESVKSVDVCHEQTAIFATGSRDGNIIVWDTRDKSCVLHGKPSIKICQAHSRTYSQASGRKQAPKGYISSVSAVAFQDSISLASAGVIDGVVKIWDLRKTYISSPKFLPIPKYKLDYAAGSKGYGLGCTSLVFDSLYKTLYACTTGNKIVKFNSHLYNNDVSVYEGFSCATYFVKIALSRDDQYLLCGSSDNKAYVWKTSKPGFPTLQLPGHDGEVSAVTWSPCDVTKLVTCGDDDRVAVWRIANKEGLERDAIFAEAEPYSGSLKSQSPSYESADRSTAIFHSKRSSPTSVQTPRKPKTCVITNFFSPVTSTPSPDKIPCRNVLPQNMPNTGEESVTRPSKTLDSSHSQILAECNHSLTNCSSNTSPPSIHCVIEKQNSPATSVSDKENSKTTNSLGQTKRKLSPSASSHKVKKSSLNISRKCKTPDQKNRLNNWTGKTIISYFSVISPPEN